VLRFHTPQQSAKFSLDKGEFTSLRRRVVGMPFSIALVGVARAFGRPSHLFVILIGLFLCVGARESRAADLDASQKKLLTDAQAYLKHLNSNPEARAGRGGSRRGSAGHVEGAVVGVAPQQRQAIAGGSEGRDSSACRRTTRT
jgi:hypothetical protein